MEDNASGMSEEFGLEDHDENQLLDLEIPPPPPAELHDPAMLPPLLPFVDEVGVAAVSGLSLSISL